jgi:mono/diheme cytochrome c family protein
LAGTHLGLAAFTTAVRTARGAMPAYGAAVMTDDVIAGLHAYLASLPAGPRPSGRAEVGAQRYEAVGCYSCHSNQAQGGTQGPRLGPQPTRWDRFTWYVRHPSGQMPPYAEAVLSDQDLADIYAFLESRPVPRPASDIALLAP